MTGKLPGKIPRFQPTLVEMPRWMFGGNPAGLADYCGWQLSIEDKSRWVWKVQTRETVHGDQPALVRTRRLSSARANQLESLYAQLLDLAPRDHVQPADVWDLAREQDSQFAESDGRTFSSSLHNIRALLMAAPTAATLQSLMPALVRERIRPALPRSSVWFIDMPRDWLSSRFGIARALVRGTGPLDENSPLGSHFVSSQHLFNDAAFGLGAYLTPLFTSLTPYVWGYAAPRAGGLIALDFGELVDGDPRPTERLLRHFSSRDRDGGGKRSAPATLRRQSFRATLDWWCGRLNVLFAEATNLASYTDRNGVFSPAMHLEKLLSLEQFFRHCESLATSRDDPHAMRVMLFMALETLGGIASSLNSQATYDYVKVDAMLAKLKAVMPANVQALLLPRAEKAIAALKSVADGFFVASRKQGDNHILIRTDDGSLKATPLNVAIRLWLRVLRNSHHGFDRDQSLQTRDLLAIHNGRFPEALSDLAWFFLLYLLAFPEVIRRARPVESLEKIR